MSTIRLTKTENLIPIQVKTSNWAIIARKTIFRITNCRKTTDPKKTGRKTFLFQTTYPFYETLKEQLDMQHLTPEQKQLGEYLIGSLDDDGLLRKSTETILDELAIYQGVYTSAEELEHVLSVIQDFDPAGIGARSLQECLLIQIRRKEDSPLKQIELDIIGKCCEDFTRKNKDKIIQKLNITEEQYNAAAAELTKLNPRPGGSREKPSGKTCNRLSLIFW